MADMNPFERLAANRSRGRETYSRATSSVASNSDQPYNRSRPGMQPSRGSSVEGTQVSIPSQRKKSKSPERPGRNPLAMMASASLRDSSTDANVGGRESEMPPTGHSRSRHLMPVQSQTSNAAPRRLRRAATDMNSEVGSNVGSSVVGSSVVASEPQTPPERLSDYQTPEKSPRTPEKLAPIPRPPIPSDQSVKSVASKTESKNGLGSSEPISPPSHPFAPGAKAMAQGLQQDKHLNGKMCTVEKVCERGYVHVFFDDAELQTSGNKGKWKLSGKNLMPVMAMFDDDSDENNENFGSDDESDDEEVIAVMAAIQASPTRPNDKIGDGLDVSVRISPKKTDISSLPKIGKKIGKKAHLWAVEVGNETFYARRTALVKCKLIKNSTLSHGKIKRKIEKVCKNAGETKAKAMMQLAERITFQEQNANLWVMMHFGSLF